MEASKYKYQCDLTKITYRIVRYKFLHMSPRVCTAPHKVYEAIIHTDPHGEAGFLHLGQILPLILDGVVPLNGTPNVFPHPAPESIEVPLEGAHAEFASGNGHRGHLGPGILMGVVDFAIGQNLRIHLAAADEDSAVEYCYARKNTGYAHRSYLERRWGFT